MEPWQEIILLLAAGFIAGIINTISGSGTLFSLGALIMIDVPVSLANTSNRPGVFVQNLSAILSFRKHGNLSISKMPWDIIAVTTFGALVGAYFAINIPDQALLVSASIAMMISLWLMLFPFQFSKWKNVRLLKYLKWLFFLLVGLYGGFIQIGVGLLMLAVISNFVTNEFKQANVLKLLVILIYTVPTTIYFIINDQILWKFAVLLATGQFFGAYLAGFFIAVNRNAVFFSKLVTVMFIFITLIKIWFF